MALSALLYSESQVIYLCTAGYRRTTSPFDLLDSSSWQSLINRHPTHVILLSWLAPNYQESFHLTRNLPACIDLIEKLSVKGLQRLVVAGTCYEYGLQCGQLNENQPANPVNYSIAKDSLRRFIENRYHQSDLQWCWARIFYPLEKAKARSFVPSLERAIGEHNPTFLMSSGRQIRDFVSVDELGKQLLNLIVHPNAKGIYNCGSGIPISLREFAEMKIAEGLLRYCLN